MALPASGREVPFTADELFVSSTDRAGRLRMANAVFVRVSGYAVEEFGEPDALRHPGMPRAIGRVGEEVLAAGRPFASHVRHLAKGGAHYWVLALSVPVADGVLTVAVKPVEFAAVREAYAEVREVEVLVEDRDPRRRELAIDAGLERLREHLGDVEAYMRRAFVSEMAAREAAVAPSRATAAGSAACAAPAAGEVAAAARGLLAELDGVSARLAGFGALSESLQRKSGFVEELAESIRVFSLNAILAAHRVTDSAAIGAVASLMQTRSDAAAPEIRALSIEIERTVTLLGDTAFSAAVGRVQAEAVLAVVDEPPLLALLVDTIGGTAEAVWTSLAAFDAALDRLAAVSATVDEHLKTIRFLELQGRIEAARADDTEHVRLLFQEIGVQVRAAGKELQEFIALGSRRNREDGGGARETRRQVAALRRAVSRTARPESR